MASDIQKCQEKGKILTLSLGGATANVGFNNDAQAAGFAKTIWDMFLGIPLYCRIAIPPLTDLQEEVCVVFFSKKMQEIVNLRQMDQSVLSEMPYWMGE